MMRTLGVPHPARGQESMVPAVSSAQYTFVASSAMPPCPPSALSVVGVPPQPAVAHDSMLLMDSKKTSAESSTRSPRPGVSLLVMEVGAAQPGRAQISIAPRDTFAQASLPEATPMPLGLDCAGASTVTLPSKVAAPTVPELGVVVPFV